MTPSEPIDTALMDEAFAAGLAEASSRMKCQDCERTFDEVMDFLVSDVIWNYVMAGNVQTTLTIRTGLFDKRLAPRSEGVGGVVCLACFDKRAQVKEIEYSQSLVVFGRNAWMAGRYDGGVPQ